MDFARPLSVALVDDDDDFRQALAERLTLEGFDRLAAVYRLLAHLHGRSVPPDARLTRQQRARARRMYRAAQFVPLPLEPPALHGDPFA